jgi:hypothetical protein
VIKQNDEDFENRKENQRMLMFGIQIIIVKNFSIEDVTVATKHGIKRLAHSMIDQF